MLCQPISREEVPLALERVKKDAAPGKDGVTVDMMSAEVVFEVWFVLLEIWACTRGLEEIEQIQMCAFHTQRYH